MNKDKITIVTAFFPLKREEWKGFERPNNKYLEYFEFWARIQNDMVIYTDLETSKYVEEIRKVKYHRDNTKVVIIEDWKRIDEEIYQNIKNTMKSNLSINFKMYPTFPEAWNAEYNYITSIKSWFVQDAVNKKLANGMIAWVDFGFNHGGDYYSVSSEFDFEWRYNFDNDKITLFTINELDDLPIFEICRRMNSYIQGGIMIAPDYLWEKFWKLSRQSILSLCQVGLADDDQTITLMAYRKNPEIFKIVNSSNWCEPLNQCSNTNFTIRKIANRKFKNLRDLKRRIEYNKVVKKYLKFWYKTLKNKKLEK